MIDVCYDEDKLLKKIQAAKIILKKTHNIDEKLLLWNYIFIIYDLISLMKGKIIYNRNKDIFGNEKEYENYIKIIDDLELEMVNNYLDNKEFISNYVGEITYGVFNELSKESVVLDYSFLELNMDDFNDIFFQFIKSINLEKFYDKYLKNILIFDSTFGGSNVNGLSVINILNHDYNFFIRDFVPNASTLFLLAHEVGHLYDLFEFKMDAKIYNSYSNQTFNFEVFPCLFEKLFFDFMINNSILKNDVQNLFLKEKIDNSYYLASSYMLSLLNNKYFNNNLYSNLSWEELYNKVKNQFNINLDSVIDSFSSLDILINNKYTFGDIYSTFLFDSINENGFSNDLIKEFIDYKHKMFNSDFIVNNNLSSEKYLDLYKKELKLLRK